jgi:hypothetical protein
MGSSKNDISVDSGADSPDSGDSIRISRRSEGPENSMRKDLQHNVDHVVKQEFGSNGQTVVQRKYATNGSVS